MSKNIIFEILYFDDCPSWKSAKNLLKTVIDELGISAEFTFTQVETQEEAVKNQFVGSPSIRLNGKDLFPTGNNHFALGCRVYQTHEGLKGLPSKEMVIEKIVPILK